MIVLTSAFKGKIGFHYLMVFQTHYLVKFFLSLTEKLWCYVYYADLISNFKSKLVVNTEYRSMSPPIFSKLFCWRDICYNLRSNSNFVVPNVKSVFHGSESISYLGPKIWDIVPLEVKELTSLNAFKNGIKKWESCRLCKQYVLNLGFI